MGAWGPHSFDNDTAADLLETLKDLDQPFEQAEAVCESFEAVFEASAGDLDADLASTAVAGAEVIAACLGQPKDGAEAPFDLEASFKFYDDAVGMALAALDRVTTAGSELAELWDETEDASTWRASVADLAARLKAAAKVHDLATDFAPDVSEADPEQALRSDVDQVYADMMVEIERLADGAAGNVQVEVLRHLVRKLHLIHSDINNTRYFIADSLDALTARIEGLEGQRS
ncbi:DUF4259 domain-containing protein [uncultured Tateyamaria sp.]|uniref:DUF4259 domain-containing protein n=1 Tax=uncultured Tateyamaria sp. TaxID=455651 RepID=UPI00260FADD6|nr:DUF4259 domain-containing protein [uncultured Tateyamaria sp.]